MFFSVLFPDTPALGMTGGPRFATIVAPSPSGDEALQSQWSVEVGAWDMVQQDRTDVETRALLSLFRLACGRAHGFLFHDHGDDAGTAELIGIGDDVTTDFQLVKHYDQDVFTYTRTILKPLSGTVFPTLDGTPHTAFSVSSTTGLVTFDTAPGLDVLVRASYRYFVPVRFDMDACDLTMVEPGISTWAGIRLVELPGGAESEAVTEAVALTVLSGVIVHDEEWVFSSILTWTDPGITDGTLLGYRLYRHANGEEFFVLSEATLIVDTTGEVDPLLREWTDPTAAAGGIVDGEHVGGYTYAVSILTPGEESAPSNLVWLRLGPTRPPIVRATRVPSTGGSIGSGYTSTHWLDVTLDWTPAAFLGGEPVDFTSLFRAFSPDAPSYLIGAFSTTETTYAETNVYGNYFGDDDGVHLVPVGEPALNGFIYEETLRGDGYTYQVISTSVTGKTSVSEVINVQHLTVTPSVPQAAAASFHDNEGSNFDREFFSYIDWSLAAPATTGGAGVWWYDLQSSSNGSTWSAIVRSLTTPTGMTTSDGGLTFSGHTGFANWDTDYYYRWRVVNDWGASDWTAPVHVNGGPFIPS